MFITVFGAIAEVCFRAWLLFKYRQHVSVPDLLSSGFLWIQVTSSDPVGQPDSYSRQSHSFQEMEPPGGKRLPNRTGRPTYSRHDNNTGIYLLLYFILKLTITINKKHSVLFCL